MVVVAQGILKTIRDEMFSHMQTLPVRFFDTHASGDIMSLYTNDTDTLRQMLAQSVPQIFSSIVTVIAVFVAMVRLSIWLTLFVLAFVAVMMVITKFVGGKSGAFFVKQQNSIGAVNGYIEEMIHGQRSSRCSATRKKPRLVSTRRTKSCFRTLPGRTALPTF